MYKINCLNTPSEIPDGQDFFKKNLQRVVTCISSVATGEAIIAHFVQNMKYSHFFNFQVWADDLTSWHVLSLNQLLNI